MASKPLEQVTLADLATKDDLRHLVTHDQLKQELALTRQDLRQEMAATRQDLRQEMASMRQDFKQELGSAVNLIMGEFGKLAARQEEMSGILARVVAKTEGVTQ